MLRRKTGSSKEPTEPRRQPGHSLRLTSPRGRPATNPCPSRPWPRRCTLPTRPLRPKHLCLVTAPPVPQNRPLIQTHTDPPEHMATPVELSLLGSPLLVAPPARDPSGRPTAVTAFLPIWRPLAQGRPGHRATGSQLRPRRGQAVTKDHDSCHRTTWQAAWARGKGEELGS